MGVGQQDRLEGGDPKLLQRGQNPVGLIAGVELVRDKTTKTPFDASVGAGNILTSETVKHGLILRQIGDTLGFSPPLVIDEAEIDEMLERFGQALDATADALAKPRQQAPLRA